MSLTIARGTLMVRAATSSSSFREPFFIVLALTRVRETRHQNGVSLMSNWSIGATSPLARA
jgi:hypothetical protein